MTSSFSRNARRPVIAIIGGGIGGLAAALALRQRGFEVTVFERSAALGEIGAGIAIAPNAVKVLRALGREPRLIQQGFEPEAYTGWDWKSGKPLFSTPRKGLHQKLYGAGYYHIHRADLHALLAEAIPPSVVRLGMECTGVEDGPSAAIASFADGTRFEADAIIGADGIRSIVRRSLFGEDAPRFTGIVCWRGMVPTGDLPPGHVPPTGSNWHGPHGHVTHYYVRRGTLVNFVAVREQSSWTDESWTAKSTRDDLLSAFEGWHPRLRLLLSRSLHYYKWGLFDREPLAEWGRGRITLLGDAAHPMLPFLGQGAAQAMEDAYALARLLEGQDSARLPDALRAYESARKPRATRVQLGSRARAGEVHLASAWKRVLRDMRYRIQGWLQPRRPANRAEWILGYDITTADLGGPVSRV